MTCWTITKQYYSSVDDSWGTSTSIQLIHRRHKPARSNCIRIKKILKYLAIEPINTNSGANMSRNELNNLQQKVFIFTG